MLEALRKSAGSLVGKLILGLLVVAFAVWGVTDVLTGAANTTAARVAGKEISVQHYAREFSALSRSYGLGAEDARRLGVDRIALNRLVEGAAMEAQAESFGLTASDAQVAAEIAKDRSFQGLDGNFSRTAYDAALRRIGMSAQDYENGVRARLTRQILADAAVEGAAPPRAAVEALEIHEAERRAVQYLKFVYAEQPEPEAPSEEALKAFHEAEAPLFTTPELRSADWVLLSAATLAKPADLTEADVQARYAASLARYHTPERRRVEQILFPDEASARAAALRARAGTSLMEIASELGRSAQETQLGLTTRELLPSDLAEAVFGLAEPGVAEPFSGGFGWTLAAASEIQPAKTTPFEEVREALAAELAAERARARLPAAVLELEDYVAGGSSLAEIAERMGVPAHDLVETDKDGFDSRGLSTDVPEGFAGFLDALFSAQTGATSPTRLDAPAGDGVLFFHLREVKPAALKPFAEVRGEVLRGWTDRQKRDAAAAKAKAALEAVAGGKSLLEASSDLEAGLQEAPLFGRRETPLDLGPDLVAKIFASAQGAAVEGESLGGDGLVVAVTTEISAPSAAEVAAQIDSRSQQYAQQWRADLTQALVAATIKAGDLHVYEGALEIASQSIY